MAGIATTWGLQNGQPDRFGVQVGENQADDIFDMSIERLFVTEPDAKEVIRN